MPRKPLHDDDDHDSNKLDAWIAQNDQQEPIDFEMLPPNPYIYADDTPLPTRQVWEYTAVPNNYFVVLVNWLGVVIQAHKSLPTLEAAMDVYNQLEITDYPSIALWIESVKADFRIVKRSDDIDSEDNESA